MSSISSSADRNSHRGRPPRAVVGSQISQDEAMFGAAFDGHVIKRFLSYVAPYHHRMYAAIAAVLVFTGTQLSIPLIIRYAIDDVIVSKSGNASMLTMVGAVFAAVVVVNFFA